MPANKQISVLSLLIPLLLFSGCATTVASRYNNQLNQAIAYSKKCSEDVSQNPDVILTYEQIIVKGFSAPNRAELLASDKKLSDAQKIAFQNFLKLSSTCDRGALELLKGSPYAGLTEGSEAISAIVDSNLLTGKISIGEANAKRLEIMQKFLSDITLLKQQLHVQDLQEAATANAASQDAITRMNTATQIRQSQMTQQILQQQNQNRFLGR